jgi:hypothetical protein
MEYSKNMLRNYFCEKCDYSCSKKSSWSQHLLTTKHSKANTGLMPANKEYACEKCKIKFIHQSSYCRHKKLCANKELLTNNEPPDKELIMMLVKQNSQLFEQNNEMLEIIKNGTHNNNNNTTNSHNKTFNLQFFLNETCKDAMNIMDFVDSIKLQLSDLERVGELGYVEGISNIILKNLKELDVTQRPVHCTDKKRETMYIKDDDKWEKDEERLKLHKVVRKVTCKNQNLIQKFKEEYPEYNKYHSKVSDKYNKIIVESMGGPGDNDFEKEEKIIQNISKQVFVDK